MEMATWLHNGVEAPWLRMAPRSAEVLVIARKIPPARLGVRKKRQNRSRMGSAGFEPAVFAV